MIKTAVANLLLLIKYNSNMPSTVCQAQSLSAHAFESLQQPSKIVPLVRHCSLRRGDTQRGESVCPRSQTPGLWELLCHAFLLILWACLNPCLFNGLQATLWWLSHWHEPVIHFHCWFCTNSTPQFVQIQLCQNNFKWLSQQTRVHRHMTPFHQTALPQIKLHNSDVFVTCQAYCGLL